MANAVDSSPPLVEEELRQWRLVGAFRKGLTGLNLDLPEESTWMDPARQLQLPDYLSLFFFAGINPVLTTTRAVCAASRLARVQREVCSRPVSLGSFSETQHVVDPACLTTLFAQFVAQVPGPGPRDPHQAWQQWFARDGSLFPALPRMHWALFGGGRAKKDGGANNAVKLHLSFNLLDDKPARAQITPGKTCERKTWKAQWEAGAAYVGDRYYAENYQCLKDLDARGCAYIVRLCDQAVLTVLEELPLTAADRAAGVTRQAWVQLGRRAEDRVGPVRVVWVQSATAGELRLVTNLSVADAPAELVSLMYRRRWQIEDFFKWLKCLLGTRHWLAESEQGVTLQLYLALIAAVLLQLAADQRPNKRMLELIQLSQLGWATLQELTDGLAREAARAAARAAKLKKS
jgi:hypothetical protein